MPDDNNTATQAQPNEGQDQVATDATTQAQPAPPPATGTPAAQGGSGPWDADLVEYFPDESARSAADRYMREKVQPRVTQLEQERSRYAPAHQLYDDLLNDPSTTFLAIAEELYGPETAQALQKQLDEAGGAAPQDETQTETQTDQPLDPRIEALLAEREQEKREKFWRDNIARIKSADPTVDDALFAPFVHAADGDFDAAHLAYQQFIARFKPAEETPAEQPAAPATVGSTGTGSTAPPTEKNYGSIQEALDDTLADMRAARQAPTTVGAV